MSKLLILLLVVGLLSGCDHETAAERTATAYKVCHDAGLVGVEGVNYLGTMVIYCAALEAEK